MKRFVFPMMVFMFGSWSATAQSCFKDYVIVDKHGTNTERLAERAYDGSGVDGATKAQFTTTKRSKENLLIIQFSQTVDAANFIDNANRRTFPNFYLKHLKQLSNNQNIHLFQPKLSKDKQAILDFFQNQPEVLSASWNAPVQFRDSIPNDELYDTQWNMERIGAPKVWEVTTGGTSFHGHEIVVAVLDKGFDLTHPDLAANYWMNEAETPNDGIDNDGNGYVDDVYGWNFRQNSPIFPVERHGTSVNGIIGASGNNDIGTAGINWNIKLMPLAIEYVDEVIAAFDYVLEMRERYNQSNGAEGAFVVVTNGSFGIDGASCDDYPQWGSMYDPLGQAGVLSVAATANQEWNVDQVGDIPTSCESEFLITVTNTGQDDNRADGAAYGKETIDLGAPGQSTPTTSLGASYREDFSGTSSACPHVSGAIALLYSLPCSMIDSLALTVPSATAAMMRDAVLKNTAPIASLADETVTGGRLDVYEAMKYLHAYCIASEKEIAAGNFKEFYLGEKDLIRVRPNPTSDYLYIDYSTLEFRPLKMRVYNMLGQKMIADLEVVPTPFEQQTVKLNVSDWAAGGVCGEPV
ncbi:MAG: S8 family serine peptidase [Saprospiraceae bacterium]|nr:S8 family serine peptidase [Saprospiraceae bacterium]